MDDFVDARPYGGTWAARLDNCQNLVNVRVPGSTPGTRISDSSSDSTRCRDYPGARPEMSTSADHEPIRQRDDAVAVLHEVGVVSGNHDVRPALGGRPEQAED